MNLFYKCRSALVILFLLTSIFSVAALRPAQSALAQSGPHVYDTNIVLGTNSPGELHACFDSLQPDTLLVDEPVTGTSALNWRTGARTQLNNTHFNGNTCGANGWLYGETPGYPGQRFSSLDPTPRPIEHTPQYVAEDGSRWVYATEPFDGNNTAPHHLWASADAGATWQERTLPPTGHLIDFSVAQADARVIYAVMADPTAFQPVPTWIYASSDAGATWTLRLTGPSVQVQTSIGAGHLIPIPGYTTPVENLFMGVSNGLGGSGGASDYYISTNGARTFTSVDHISNQGYHSLEVVHTQEGIVRSRHGQFFGPQELTLTTDGGETWAPLPLPPFTPLAPPAPGVPAHPAEAALTVARVAPANLFLADVAQGLWHSPDNGHTWTQLTGMGGTVVATSPYLPLAVLYADKDHRLHVVEVPDAGKRQVAAAPPSHAPGSAYYPVPGINHNVPEVFVRYWAAHGGLAQFGYPRTEAFKEVNAADGKIYLAQYFERNRFEYHPEYAGTDAEILLGLLGNEQAAPRRAAGERPFAPLVDPYEHSGQFFAKTGHTLEDQFLAYWEAHGGLDLYGYPISQPFREQNPDNGQLYLVQYFERNRFELHPENAGSPYEVLLGLLGNDLLKQKGWQ